MWVVQEFESNTNLNSNLVEVDVVLGNRCSLVVWFTTFLVCQVVVGVETENNAISAFN